MLLTAIVLSLSRCLPTQDFDAIPSASPQAWSWWEENLRWNLDTSLRFVADGRGDTGFLGSIGLDVHKVISSADRDIATLVLQPYLLRTDSVNPPAPIFDGDHDFEFQWRIFNANVNLSGDSRLNLRVGHFEFPFGLEQNIDTNGTLRQYTHSANFGFKTDWGTTLNGEVMDLEYEFGWSRGSGNEYLDRGGSGVWSGRIGTSRYENNVYGVSFLSGDLLGLDGIEKQHKLGLDAQFFWRSYSAFFEVSAGEEAETSDVVRAVAELGWHDPLEAKSAWLQLFATRVDSPDLEDESLELRLGGLWRLNHGVSVSAQLVQSLDPLGSAPSRGLNGVLQLRYRLRSKHFPIPGSSAGQRCSRSPRPS